MQAEAGGHGYSTTREIKGLSDILSKTGSISLVATEAAQNALTHAQEFAWGDTFMNFSYQNKGGKLLANGRPVADINDENEIGGNRMGRVISALDRMIQDDNIAESIVVSEDLGYGRHFIYRYRKGENDNIEGLAFEYQGTTEELGEVVNQLGTRAIDSSADKPARSFDFSKPLFFTEESKNNIEDLSQAAHQSFKTEARRQEMKSYLGRLDRDTTQFDQLIRRRQKQEAELARQFKEVILSNKDAQTGIAAAVYGAIDIAEKMGRSEGRRREENMPILNRQAENIRKQDAKDRIDLSAKEIRVIPASIDHTGRFTDKEKTIDTLQVENQRVGEYKLRPDQVQIKELITSQVVEPLTVGLVGLTAAISAITDDRLSTDIEDKNHGDMPIWNPVSDGEYKQDDVSQSDQFRLQQFIAAIFMPIGIAEQESQILFGGQAESGAVENVGGFLSEEMSLGDKLMEFMPIVDESEFQKPLLVVESRNSEVLIAGFQQGLELIAGLVTNRENNLSERTQKGEKTMQEAAEADVIHLGQELLKVFASGLRQFGNTMEETEQSQIDSLARLSFLLHVYKDPDSSGIAKHLLAALIYKQVGKMINGNVGNEAFTQNPKIGEIYMIWGGIVQRAGFLDSQFDLLFALLKKNFPADFLSESGEDGFIGQMVRIISQLSRPYFSFEKLPGKTGGKIQNIFSFGSGKKKRKQTQGIIYIYYPKERLRYLSRSVDV